MTVVLTLRALPGVDETKALRPILKRLLRTYGMRCVALRPVHESQTIRRRDARRRGATSKRRNQSGVTTCLVQQNTPVADSSLSIV